MTDTRIDVLLKKYILLVEFLGKTLGPNYEICLYDMTRHPQCVIAMANEGLTGRSMGSPLTDLLLKLLASGAPKENNYILNSKGISKTGDVLRSSTMFLKEKENLIGLFCVSSNVSKYERISKEILDLCNLGVQVKEFSDYQFSEKGYSDRVETYANSAAEVTISVLNDAVKKYGVSVDRLSYEEKLTIIEDLNQRGIFLLKGAVPEVAALMQSSEASVYRYLSKINKLTK